MVKMVTQEFVRSGLVNYCVKEIKNRTTYLVPLTTLKQLEIKRWSRQRPADSTRISEIRKYIEFIGDCSGVLSLAWHPTEGLVIYDGQHRWNALLELNECEIHILVEILWEATEKDIEDSFLTVNRCVAVPELYTDATNLDSAIRAEIEGFVKDLVATHKEFVSSNDKPNRPNFNRDRLTSDLYELWRDEYNKEVAFPKIAKALLALNDKYDLDPESPPRKKCKNFPRILEKCNKHSFWLFAEKGSINILELRKIVESMK